MIKASIKNLQGTLLFCRDVADADALVAYLQYLQLPGFPEGYTVEQEVLDVHHYDWIRLRSERDSLLSSCDRTQLADFPISVETKALWATYRQTLRDLPENTQDPSSPVWPTPPA